MHIRTLKRSFENPHNSRISTSIITGILTTITAAALVIILVSTIISSITLPSRPGHWANIARTRAYDLCYDGCHDCLEVSIISAACALTSRVAVPVITCDASQLWTWSDGAKYPPECLEAVGAMYEADALRERRYWYHTLYLLTLLTLLLGYITHRLVRRLLEKLDVFERAGPRRRIANPGGSRGSSATTPLLAATILIALVSPTVAAYRCIQEPARDILFSNKDDRIYGVVHAWLSECYEETYSCGEACSSATTSLLFPDERRDCDTLYCTRPRAVKTPRDFALAAISHVQSCGFRRVDVVPGVVDRRISNWRIEGELNVKIAVNRFNGTDAERAFVEDGVRCLFGIV